MNRARWAWPAAWAGALGASAALAMWTPRGGDAAFVAGAVSILASIFFIGIGGDRRSRRVRSLMGAPIAYDPIEPEKRQRQISRGLKVFLLGVALWVPLAYLAIR